MVALGYQGGGEIGGYTCICILGMYVYVHVRMLVFGGLAFIPHGCVALDHSPSCFLRQGLSLVWCSPIG